MRNVVRNQIYYRLKPFIPWRMRIAARRVLAQRLRRRHQHVWPIDPGAGKVPKNWPGWPGGKEFAVVLSHDVEANPGVEQCRALATLESRHGFRSSFNFIPEGTYTVPARTRHWLTDQGFEVGVHDLHHDGKLYASRERFREHAARINHYLKTWDAVGFRSGFMLHKLEWLHDLEISYDASTFDTDPFEPQPDGAGTIYPYWIQDREGRGYVELPYSLAQDSTLFLLFGEKTADCWKQKLDWVAAHGGMALVNIHPDYVQFTGAPKRERALMASVIEELLDYVRTRYAGRYWHALPKEVAAFYRDEVHSRRAGHSGHSSNGVSARKVDATPLK